MSKTKPKDKILRIPLVGSGLRIISNVVRAPQYKDATSNLLEDIAFSINKMNENIELLRSRIDTTSNEVQDINNYMEVITKSQDSLQRQFALFEKTKPPGNPKNKDNAGSKDSELFANDHLQDLFYTSFEDKFRGDEEMIKERLQDYAPDFTKASVDFKKYPVLDIGSGRGEILQVLKKNKINAMGLDINVDMVERTKSKGLKAEQGDALDYLQSVKLQSFGAITGFHIVEHIPFNILLRIFKSAHQALVKDGFVLFETPNPENIIVGSCAFYMDPSHLHPIPPHLLAFALEICGFRKVVIRRINPVTEYEAGDLPEEVISRFYGPRDYAVIGFK